MLIPSSFTYDTGNLHWDLLTQTRVLDSLDYVIAPNQYDYDSQNRRCYGYSRIIDPLGKVIGGAVDDYVVFNAQTTYLSSVFISIF